MLRKNKILLINISIFLALFAVSVGVRVVNMKAPLGRGHEWIVGHMLLTHSIYEEGGLSRYYFAPVWTFDKPAENHLISTTEFRDKRNSTYYVSYPPFSFLAPYFCFKLVGIAPTVTAIRVFGLAVHLACAFLILCTMYSFFRKKLRNEVFLPAFVASAIYLLAAGNLWFHSNIYFADTLEQLFAISSIFLLSKAFCEEEKRSRPGLLFLIGAINFLGVYTEWLQVFIAFSACLIGTIYCLRSRRFIGLVLTLATSTLLAISLTFWQYNSIAGFEPLKKVLTDKYSQRSGRGSNSEDWANASNRQSVLSLTKNYEKHYSHVLNLAYFSILLLLTVFLLSRRRLDMLKAARSMLIALLILALALAMHLFVFFNFNVIHDFGTLKCSTLFCLVIGIGLAGLQHFVKGFLPSIKIACVLLFVGLCGYFISESVNRYYNNNNSNQVTYYFMNIGEAVRKYAKDDEIVFGRTVTPVTNYFAQRNVFEVRDLSDARGFLQRAKYNKGIFIDGYDPQTGLIARIIRFNSAGDSLVVDSNFLPKVYTDPLTGKVIYSEMP